MVEAAGVDQVGEPEGRSRLAGYGAETRLSEAKDGGGGGSRTRVRRHVLEGIYMRVRFVFLMPDVWKRLSTARHQTR